VHTTRLRIGRMEFFGTGVTRQLARHDAAQQALSVLRTLYNNDEHDVRLLANNKPNSPTLVAAQQNMRQEHNQAGLARTEGVEYAGDFLENC